MSGHIDSKTVAVDNPLLTGESVSQCCGEALPLPLSELPHPLSELAHPFSESGTHFPHLWYRDGIAVAVAGVFCEKVLVVILSRPKIGGLLDRGHHPTTPQLIGAVDGGGKLFALLRIRREHRRTVLGANICALPVELSRVVQSEKNVEHDIGGNDRLVELDADRLRVTGAAGAHLLIARLGNRATDITGGNGTHTANIAVHGIKTPKAATGENKCCSHARKSTLNYMTPVPLVALLDGSLHDVTSMMVRPDDLGIVRGDGVFDVAHGYAGRFANLDANLERLANSARILSLPEPDAAGYRRAVAALTDAWDWDAAPETTLRMVLTRGPETESPETRQPSAWAMISAISKRVVQEREGVRVLVLDRGIEAEETSELPWLLPGAKSLSYGINMAAKRWAAAHGADDALFVSPSGRLLEGPTSSLVLDIDGELVTPTQDGLLRSLTIQAMIDGAPAAGLTARFDVLNLADLDRARGGWLVSTGRILAPIIELDGKPFPISPLHDQLAQLLEVPGRG